MKALYYDLETTGVKYWKNGIHQISGIIEVDGVIMERFNFKVKPNSAAIIEDEALKVGGVTKEQIMDYEPMRSVYSKLMEILTKYVDRFNKKDKFYLIGYNNTSFDNQFLRAWFTQNTDPYFSSWFWSDSRDAMVAASTYLEDVRPNMENFQLRTVAKQMGLEVDEAKLHDAAYDLELTYLIYKTATIKP